jgi:hypothetical protein
MSDDDVLTLHFVCCVQTSCWLVHFINGTELNVISDNSKIFKNLRNCGLFVVYEGKIYLSFHHLSSLSFFFFNLYSGGWNQGPLDTAATNGLLCQPRVIMMVEKSVE